MAAACGGDRDTGASKTGGSSETGGGTAAPQASAPRDACALLSTAEVAAIAGEPVAARPGRSGRTFSGCGWFGTQSGTPYLELTVYWTGGREQWQSWRAANQMAGSLMRANEGVELDSIVKPGPVAGLGDSAAYAELAPGVVLQGDVLLELTTFHLPDARRNFRPLAQKVLTRI
jgi:hypothetical protein